jgi:hypothetical protein
VFGLGADGVFGTRIHEFFPIKQGPFGVGGTLETGVALEGGTVEAGFKQQAQEILSRDGPADSLVPVGNLILPVRRQRRHQDHIREHEAATGFQDAVGFLQGLGFIEGEVEDAV